MELSEQDIEEFQAKYHEHCGEELSKDHAADYARRVIRMMEIIYTPMSTMEMAEMQKELERIRQLRYGNVD